MDHYRQAVLRALEQIERDLREPISLDAIARRAGFSLWHFHRVFAEQTGESLGTYIRRRRLTAAAHEIAASDRSILDLALDFQFESNAAFTRAFKSCLGFSPSEFRRHGRLTWLRTLPPITPAKLQQLPVLTTMKPRIIELPPLRLLGLSARFIGPMSPDANNLAVIPPLYGQFHALRPSLPAARDQFIYGACRCPEEKTRRHPDEQEYLVAINVAPRTTAPRGTEVWPIPASTYALFTHRGPVAKIDETINYAFGTWLPRSKFIHTGGPNFDRSDERFGDGGDDCEFDFLVPVRAK
jgi:AraC family transcriptional regulator